MMTATFSDGTACRLDVIHGDRFEPRDGETFLFEFPEGTLKEGAIHFESPPEACWDRPPFRGIYDRDAKTVALEG